MFKLVSVGKGGGQQIIDVHKDLDHSSLLKEVTEVYFPNGFSKAQNLKLEDVFHYVASFSGSTLPLMEEEGGFTVSKYFKRMKSVPVRMYLHTQPSQVHSNVYINN